MLKIIVAGGRDFKNYRYLAEKLDWIIGDRTDVEIVCGLARGADMMGYRYAKERKLSIAEFPADWNKYGKGAGYRRNGEMARYADCLVAFWDYESKGTEHMISLMKGYKKKAIIYKY